MSIGPNAQFIPASNVITAITTAIQPTITTASPHGYSVGAFVRLNIPKGFGMQQANLQETEILSVPTTTTFVCDFNTSQLVPFAVPASPKQEAQVVPIGEASFTLQSSKRNVLGNAPDLSF